MAARGLLLSALGVAALLARGRACDCGIDCDDKLEGAAGNIKVTSGCKVISGSVAGNIHVSQGASVIVQGAVVGGNIHAERAGQLCVRGSTRVRGDIIVEHSFDTTVCDEVAANDVEIEHSRDVTIADAALHAVSIDHAVGDVKVDSVRVASHVKISNGQGSVSIADSDLGRAQLQVLDQSNGMLVLSGASAAEPLVLGQVQLANLEGVCVAAKDVKTTGQLQINHLSGTCKAVVISDSSFGGQVQISHAGAVQIMHCNGNEQSVRVSHCDDVHVVESANMDRLRVTHSGGKVLLSGTCAQRATVDHTEGPVVLRSSSLQVLESHHNKVAVDGSSAGNCFHEVRGEAGGAAASASCSLDCP